MPYTVEFAQSVEDHFRALPTRDRTTVLDAIRGQLLHDPLDDRWQGGPAVKKLRLSSAVRPLAEYVADLSGETVVLTEGNRAIAAIVPLKNVDRESLVLSQHPEFLELIAPHGRTSPLVGPSPFTR